MDIKGEVKHYSIDSHLLIKNKNVTQPKRPLVAYIPASSSENQRFPVLYCLASWTGAGRKLMEWSPFKESLPERLERLIEKKVIPPCVVVCPDLYTYYGGSQYINSEYFGPHGDHIVEEVIPFVESQLPVLAGSRHRGVFGISSGGFGALRLCMEYPGVFAAMACHSGDMGFELVYGPDLVKLATGLASFDGQVDKFLESCQTANKISGFHVHLLMLLGMAGFYSPNKDTPVGYDLPIDLYSGARIGGVWDKWLANDPVQMVEKPACREALQDLEVLYVECGFKDQYNLHFGARQLENAFKKYSINHIYAEFDDNHSGLAYRYDVSLPKLLEKLS